MEPRLSPELESFRAEVADWISANRVPALAAVYGPGMERAVGGLYYGAWLGPPGALADAYTEWIGRNAEAGYMCPQWPVEYGGRGWDALQMALWNQELARAGMPPATRGLGEQMVGPAVIVHGTDQQKAHFLPRIISGEDVYGQAFSEPNAGSDLASLQTKGVVDGDHLVITGQKIWTSNGHIANRLFLLCRTDPAVPKHRGISYVLVDVADNHIEVRFTEQMAGEHEFTEEFIDGARAPLFNVIGGLNNGWKVAMTTLGNERGAMATVQHVPYERHFAKLVGAARERKLTSAATLRDELARVYSGFQLMRFSGLRILASMASERQIGPESSMYKLFSSEYGQRLGELSLQVFGAEMLVRPEGDGYHLDEWQYGLLHGRALTIMAGSSQIQRNILGERVLGLPKDGN